MVSVSRNGHICCEYVGYYHECRPHQGIGNRLIGEPKTDDEPPTVVSLDQIKCETRLGGLLKNNYYHTA